MKLTDQHTRSIAKMYAAVFIAVSLWYVFHRLTFTQINPVFFSAKPDVTGHLIFSTGLQHAVIKNTWFQVLLDILFLLLTPLQVLFFIKRYKITTAFAWLTLVFNVIYCYLLSCVSFVSLEPFVAWMLFPLLFTGFEVKGFYFRVHILRILFILFFASAGLWKLRSGGAFNPEQFSGILINQYATVLASGGNGWFTKLVIFLINNPVLSFTLYWIVLLGEIFFLAGLFTKRFDKTLLWILIVFLVVDYFMMEINYFSWLPFALLFYYSRFDLPAEKV